ncbi:MAG: rhodanese-like domain-containing protein [Candidatus Marinimicrobia bacterium]|nr:rhodanese-like domain-containing protein [Candidatus Neomarinimicrobiota bacterium]
MKSITVQELKQVLDNNKKFTLLDVREERELIMASIKGFKHIPMMAIPYQLEMIPKDEPVYVLCHSGIRLAQASLYLQQQGIDAINILGGIHAWSLEVDPEVPVY